MKASIVAASAALIGSVAAAHPAHAGFHLRRGAPVDEVCTVYTTVYVYPSEIPVPVANTTSVYVHKTSSTPCSEKESSKVPEYTPAPPPPAYTPETKPSKEAYTPAPQPSKEAYTPAPKPSKEAYTPAPPAYTPSSTPSKVEEKPKPSKPAEKPSYNGGNGRIVTKGDKWAITYTPYTAGGQCKSQGEVQTDIAKIAGLGFTTIRVYSTDCFVFENVVPATQKHGLKIIYGIFLEAGGKGGKGPFSEYANNQLNDIIKNSPKDSIALIIVGNESLFNNYCTAEELASYIEYVKQQLSSAGFPKDIAVTTTEPVDVWESKGAALCSVIDVFAVQVHPFFTSKVYAGEAGKFAAEQLEKAAKVCPGAAAKGKYITEIGWPKEGQTNGNAKPGVSEQKEAIKNILETVGKEAILFSFHDDKWKAEGAYGVEQSWGCAEALY